ncbi:unnamed protein product [Ectocarpus sp. 13 AM-2016]
MAESWEEGVGRSPQLAEYHITKTHGSLLVGRIARPAEGKSLQCSSPRRPQASKHVTLAPYTQPRTLELGVAEGVSNQLTSTYEIARSVRISRHPIVHPNRRLSF